MKKIKRLNAQIGGEMNFPYVQENITGAKRHPVIFHSRKRYSEAEEEE